MDPAAEAALIQQVERADAEQLAGLLSRPTAGEEEVLVAYLGEDRYTRMHERALQRNLRRAAAEPLGNVIVLHGIMGAELSTLDQGRGTTAIWAHIMRLVTGGLRRLELDANGVRAAQRGDECSATAILTRYYGELLLALSERWRTRAFFYDWRKPLTTSARDLGAAIDHWFPGEPVHFVAHSMGGLVARTFIAQDARWAQMARGLVNGNGGRLVMLGTPNHGAYDIPRVLTGLDALVRRLALLDVGLSLDRLVGILRTFPAPYFMLPSPLVDLRADALYRATTWPGGASQRHLDEARAHHEMLATVADPKRMLYVAGSGHPTYDSVDPDRVEHPDGYSMSSAGDGRVPHRMGHLDAPSGPVPMYFSEASHGGLTSDRAVLAALDELLKDGATVVLPETAPTVRGPAAEPAVMQEEVEADNRQAEQELRALLRQIAVTDQSAAAPARGAMAGARRHRTGASARPAHEAERRAEDNLVRDVLTTPAAEASRSTQDVSHDAGEVPTIEIALVHGDITTVHDARSDRVPRVDVIAVGHYVGVKPQAAERHLDEAVTRALDGAPDGRPLRADAGLLTELTLRGTISGDLGQPFFLDDPRDATRSSARRRMICVTGLGLPGRFGPGELVVVVRELAWTAGRLGHRHLASVLIGAGNGNLTEKRAVSCWLRGLAQGLAGTPADGRLRRVTIVEMEPERMLRIDDALKRLVPALADDLQLDAQYDPLKPDARQRLQRAASSGERKSTSRARDDEQRELPTRITLTRHGDAYRFGAITASAAVPERDVPIDPLLVSEANDELAGERDATRRLERGQFLGRLLIPHDLSDQLNTRGVVVMILDASTARIHWELVAQWESDRAPGEAAAAAAAPQKRFLGIGCGLTRQLRTTFAPPPEPPPPPDRRLRVLVVADPAEDAHLPGAEEEGIAVADLFERFDQVGAGRGVEVVRLMGPRRATRTEVLRHLLMQRFHVMHFAGHCFYNKDDPSASGWIFTNNAIISASELRRIDRVPEFVFSNACESGVTPERAGNRSAGLAPSFAEAFFERGVGNFVCTAWPVGDNAARQFALHVYRALLGLTQDDVPVTPLPMHIAMARAREEVAKMPDGERSWGAYQHYGDPLYRLVSTRAGDTSP